MSDTETLEVYNAQVDAYADMVTQENPGGHLKRFAAALPSNGRVLDIGCGPGNSAAYFKDQGLDSEAWDASSEMVRIAKELYGLDVKLATFNALTAQAHYDGIWANFSLLHAKKDDFFGHLRQIHKALKPGGLFHIGMKLGEGERRDKIGRFYSYYSKPELLDAIKNAGFKAEWTKEGSEPGLSGEVSPWLMVQAVKT